LGRRLRSFCLRPGGGFAPPRAASHRLAPPVLSLVRWGERSATGRDRIPSFVRPSEHRGRSRRRMFCPAIVVLTSQCRMSRPGDKRRRPGGGPPGRPFGDRVAVGPAVGRPCQSLTRANIRRRGAARTERRADSRHRTARSRRRRARAAPVSARAVRRARIATHGSQLVRSHVYSLPRSGRRGRGGPLSGRRRTDRPRHHR